VPEVYDPWSDDWDGPRSSRLVPWILVGAALIVIALVVLFVSFAPSANAAGGCGGG
jgi:hypothetical protein